MSLRTVRRALLSVSDKTGLLDLARCLADQGVELISTGGTVALAARELKAQGAKHVLVAALHGLFVGNAWDKLAVCDEVATSDTIPSRATKFSVAPEFAGALRKGGP